MAKNQDMPFKPHARQNRFVPDVSKEVTAEQENHYTGTLSPDEWELPPKAAPLGPVRGYCNKSPISTHDPYAGKSGAGG